ncbi:DoxX family protein [Phenylobacterium terrae]|uniref:DoxX family protein n=1 Tax=Phenylobacterium terrae TaxID=2665495 RepID=A0ABW4N173_9CAUL
MFTNASALAGRAALSAIFLWSAHGKFQAPDAVMGYIASYGVPHPQLAYVAALLAECVGGVLILLGPGARWASLALAGFCLATAVIFHRQFGDQNELIHALKNLAIAGGLLQLAAFGPGRWTIAALPWLRVRDAHARG